MRSGRRDTYLHLYEHFLELYDNELRKKSGSYYTPREVVDDMVRLTEEALVKRLGKVAGFRDPDVLTVDPAMGTGTYLHTILERAAQQAAAIDGPGAVAGAVTQVADRLVGFELQMGPYAVAELRTTDLLASHAAEPPPAGMHLYVTDTLDDPHTAETQLGSGLQLIARSRRRANEVKAKADVTVVIGNPPYKQLADGAGGWVENGGLEHGKGARAILEDFFVPGIERVKAKLKNAYVYFWRWATWKVWESTTSDPDGDTGIVCFISTAGYLTGPAFTGMREYLRRNASEGWIIDLTPEGQTPDIPTRIFPGVRQPLAIGLFVRTPLVSTDVPATIRYRSLEGRQADKFASLAAVTLDDDGWREARTGWQAPLTPAVGERWDTFPALSDVFPWYSPGVFPTRTWVYAPNAQTLRTRWGTLVGESDPSTQSAMFKQGRDATLDKTKQPLPGIDAYQNTTTPVRSDRGTGPQPVRISYRAFDRQWILPDNRLLDMPRRDLWAARIPGQIFLTEQHSHVIGPGPGVIASTLIPDFHHFDNRGGRALPFLHPDGSPNISTGLLDAVSGTLGHDVSAQALLAYVAGVVAHPGYTVTFTDELTTPGIRVPVTGDAELWAEAVALGEQVIWLHSYGEEFTGADRPHRSVRFPSGDPRQPLSLTQITSMPDTISYDDARQAVIIGDGEFGPVPPGAWLYCVGGRNVIKSWFNYRKKDPGGRRTSPLNAIHPTIWDPDWTVEAIDLLTVLTRLVDLEHEQADLLARILNGPLVSRAQLAAAGARWPTAAKERKPRYSLGSPGMPAPDDDQTTLDL